MAMPTLLDIAKSTGSDGIAGLIEEVQTAAPEIQLGPARTIKGNTYKATVRTSLPTGGFRAANAGSTPVISGFEQRMFECFIADSMWRCDKAVADIHEDGPEAYIAAEAAAILRGQMINLGSQFYYGVASDPNRGFPGLIAQYDATNMVVDAGGTTAATGSSVWLLKWGEDGAQWLYGNKANPLQLSDLRVETGADPNDSTKILTYYTQNLLAWVGFKLGSLYSAVRIKKLTADSGKGLTDNLIASALALFPVGFTPDVMLMSRRSLFQLRASRTATNPTGQPAPIPAEAFNIPIAVTDSIVNTEALTL